MIDYKSQYGQDKWVIEELFPETKSGYFVDLAAGDGEFISNTHVLEKVFGWSGICVEPNTTSYKKLCTNRDCIKDSSVIMVDDFDIDFIEYKMMTDFEHLLSTAAGASDAPYPIERIEKRPTISLNTLLNKHKAPDTIHYISLDIEGSEIYVLQDFLPTNTRKVLAWSIECNPGAAHEQAILDWMNAYDYELVNKDGLNGRLGHDYLFTLKNYKTLC